MSDSIFAVQVFEKDKWRTMFLSSFRPDAAKTYGQAIALMTAPMRFVEFAVESLDFIATHATDFERIAERP